MPGPNSIFGQILVVRSNVELWRTKVADAEQRLKVLYEPMVNGQAPAGSERQFAVLLTYCDRFKFQLEDAEMALRNLEALQN